jgi:glutathione S-transferase
MLKLYHVPVGVCPQKVRICLAEKGLSWESEDISNQLRSPEYLKLNPGGYAPTLWHDGRIVTESRIINEYLDDAFDGPALQPSNAYDRARMRLWTKQIDDSLHAAIYILSLIVIFQDLLTNLPESEREQRFPLDPLKRERTLNVLSLGWESPHVSAALQRFVKLISEMERTLSESPWLAGEEYSLADVDYTPYLRRLEDLGVSWLWNERPAISDWLSRVRARPSYPAMIADWVPAALQNQIEARGREASPKFQEVLRAASSGKLIP